MLKSLFHWKVLINVLAAAAVFTGLVWLSFRWLEFHTNHGREIAVPNVVNMTVHKAIEVLDDSGLDYEVDSFKYDPKFKPFQVLQIYPSPGSRVKDGRTIVLKVNPRTWAKVSVPDILDRYKFLAFRQLDLVGLKVGDTIYEPSIQKDAVIGMRFNGTVLKPGSLLPKFSVIDLVIGTGPKRNVTIPNVVGLTVQEARAVISQNYFEVGLIEHEDGKRDDSDIVYYQDPEGGAVRDQGMQIDIWASKKTPAEMQGKISALNEIYRVRIEPIPEVNYEDYEPAPEPRRSTSVETPKPEPKVTAPTETAPVTSTKPKTESVKPAPAKPAEEKPKAKKVIVE